MRWDPTQEGSPRLPISLSRCLVGPFTSTQPRACGLGSELQDPRDWKLGASEVTAAESRQHPAASTVPP